MPPNNVECALEFTRIYSPDQRDRSLWIVAVQALADAVTAGVGRGAVAAGVARSEMKPWYVSLENLPVPSETLQNEKNEAFSDFLSVCCEEVVRYTWKKKG